MSPSSHQRQRNTSRAHRRQMIKRRESSMSASTAPSAAAKNWTPASNRATTISSYTTADACDTEGSSLALGPSHFSAAPVRPNPSRRRRPLLGHLGQPVQIPADLRDQRQL